MTPKGEGELLRRQGRLRWMAGEVGQIQGAVRSHRAALDDLAMAARRGPLPAEERARRHQLAMEMQSLRLRLKELHAEFEAVRSGVAR